MIRALRLFFSDLTESVRIALEQLRAHILRSILTALGVIIGVWAVIFIGVFINGLNRGVAESLDMLGNDHFYVERWPWENVGDNWVKYINRPLLQARYAEEINQIIADTPDTSLMLAVPTVVVQRGVWRDDRQINNVFLFGTNADFNYINTGEVEYGRFFTETENTSGQNVVVLGAEVAEALFPEGTDQAVGKTVRIARIKFQVIGVFAKQGSFLGMQSFDRNVGMPLPAMRKFFLGHGWWNDSTSIRVVKKPEADREVARDEIIGAMRRVRGLMPGEENDFEVNSSEAVENTLGPLTAGLALAGFFITGLALFVGAVGIMNITFVSVKERTKEIGTRRAIGARRSSILMQFLVEAVSICLVGGIVGLGIAVACERGLEAVAPSFPAFVSGGLIIGAFVVSVVTGILAGIIPAFMASRLDPATALRHE